MKKDEKVEGYGKGLANVKNRLEHFYADDGSFEMLNNENQGTTITLVITTSFESVASRQS